MNPKKYPSFIYHEGKIDKHVQEIQHENYMSKYLLEVFRALKV